MHEKVFMSQMLKYELKLLISKNYFFFKISSVDYTFISRIFFNVVFCVFDD